MKKFGEFVKREVRELIPPTLFFFIAFHIIALSRSLMLHQYGVSVSATAGVAIGALLVGKAVLIADLLPFVNLYPHKPLIYNVLWKTAIYTIAAMIVRYLEHLIPYWWRTGGFVAGNRELEKEIVWPFFWTIQLWLCVLLFLYCTSRELVRAIGAEEVKRMFFGIQPKAGSKAEAG